MVEIASQIREQLIDSEEYDEKRPGDDPSQIFQIREYREGDRMQRIHWKASARTSQLMVKDYSMPIGSGALVLFDLRVAEDAGMVFLDQAVEYGLAILQGFLNQEYPPRAAWYNCPDTEYGTDGDPGVGRSVSADVTAVSGRTLRGRDSSGRSLSTFLSAGRISVSVCGLPQTVSGGQTGS